jgi:hypothetical protein
MESISKFIDIYDYKTRLYPVFLATIFPLFTMWTIFPNPTMSFGIFTGATAFASIKALSFLGCFKLMSSLIREKGKRIEVKLFNKWGGKPTTLMLMFTTTSLDSVTVARYRKTLENKIPNFNFISKDQEIKEQNHAIAACESAVRWLREATRDSKKYPFVFIENVNYGFRRNLLGIKPIALLFCFIAFLFSSLQAWRITEGHLSLTPNNLVIAITISIIGLLFWSFAINANFVKTAAFTYAKSLIESCDSPHFN